MENHNNPIGSGDMDSCNHDKRFAGVFDLPRDCHGCLACYSEKLAAENNILRGDKWTDEEIAAISAIGLTAAEINVLPLRVKSYIHNLETNADPAGTIQDLAAQKENCAALAKQYADMKTLADHLEILLGRVWDTARDHNLSMDARVDKIMTTIRTCPGDYDYGLPCQKRRHHDGECGSDG